MIRIAAVDDELHVLERFKRMILEIEEVELCGLFETGEDLLSYLKEHPIDVVFLDIEMPEINGLELSAKILDLYETINIVFVTAFHQYAVEAFEVQALDYILKPLTRERLEKTIARLIKYQRKITPYKRPVIQCMGDFEVFLGQEVMVWKNSKAKEIFAFLVHKAGVPVTWEKIAGAIWPEYNTQKAQTNFHATMYLLRKRLAEAGLAEIIESGRGNYRIVTDRVDCDLYQIEEMINGRKKIGKEEFRMLNQFKHKGYLEESGYDWAQPKAAELEELCNRLMAHIAEE